MYIGGVFLEDVRAGLGEARPFIKIEYQVGGGGGVCVWTRCEDTWSRESAGARAHFCSDVLFFWALGLISRRRCIRSKCMIRLMAILWWPVETVSDSSPSAILDALSFVGAWCWLL